MTAAQLTKQLPEADEFVSSHLLMEMNHRIGNSLQFASSILSVRASRTASKEVRMELMEVASRIHAVALLHRRLSQFRSTGLVNLGGYLQELCSELGASTVGGNGAEFEFKNGTAEPVHIDSNEATQLGIIVTELLTNCAKYAGEKPVCSVILSKTAGSLTLTVSDDGPGFSAVCAPLERGSGLGLQLVRGLVSQLKATMEILPSVSGAHIVITLPSDMASV